MGGTSPAMLTLEAVLSEIAPTNIPVLLVGECGTGKQMFAHRIHQLSERSTRAVDEDLVRRDESGVVCKRARSGCRPRRAEYGREAGTAFFDEISELDRCMPKESLVRAA